MSPEVIFKAIRTGDEDLDRVQQNIAQAFHDLAGEPDPSIVMVTAAEYRVSNADRFVLVSSTRGPVTIVLPTGGGATPAVKRVVGSNKVTLMAADRALIDGRTSLDLALLESLTLVHDGRAWWRF